MRRFRNLPKAKKTEIDDASRKKATKIFILRVVFYYLLVYALFIFYFPAGNVNLNTFQGLIGLGHYTGILPFILFLFFTPQKLTRAKFWPPVAIYFLLSLTLIILGEFSVNIIKLDLGLGQAWANFFLQDNIIYTFSVILLHNLFFLLALGVRKFANYLYDINV